MFLITDLQLFGDFLNHIGHFFANLGGARTIHCLLGPTRFLLKLLNYGCEVVSTRHLLLLLGELLPVLLLELLNSHHGATILSFWSGLIANVGSLLSAQGTTRALLKCVIVALLSNLTRSGGSVGVLDFIRLLVVGVVAQTPLAELVKVTAPR